MEIVGLKHIKMTDEKLIIGIDGGGTTTRCVLFDSVGSTIDIVNDKVNSLKN